MHSRHPHSPKDWTFLVYVGSVDDEQTSIDRKMIQALTDAPANGHVNVVYQLVTKKRTVRAVIHGGGSADVWADGPSINVTRAKHVTSFVDWAEEVCPGRHTALFLKGHGEGWVDPIPIAPSTAAVAGKASAPPRPSSELHTMAIFYDGVTKSWMRTASIRKAIEQTRRGRVDVYGFDACFMSSIEVAYEIRNVASFMVGTELEESSEGWPYAAFLRGVTAHTSPRALSRAIVEKARPDFKLASIELEWMKVLAEAMDRLGAELSIVTTALAAWTASNGPPNREGANNIDLVQLLELLEEIDRKELVDLGKDGRAALGHARKCLDRATLGGVSIFFPWCPAQNGADPPRPLPCPLGSPYLATYAAVKFGRRTRWASFLSDLNLAWINQLRAIPR